MRREHGPGEILCPADDPECPVWDQKRRVDPPASHYRGRDASYLAPPRTDPYGPNSGIWLPPWVSDGEAPLWPRMKDSWFREPVVGQPLDPLPGRPVFLAPLP